VPFKHAESTLTLEPNHDIWTTCRYRWAVHAGVRRVSYRRKNYAIKKAEELFANAEQLVDDTPVRSSQTISGIFCTRRLA